jgi:hypothetical protein
MPGITPTQLIAFCGSVYEAELDGTWTSLEAFAPGNAQAGRKTAQLWALISACNPHAMPLSEAENQARHAALRRAIDAAGAPCHPGRGRAADFSWVEDSWLVHASPAQVDSWACACGQHAVYLPAQDGKAAGLRIYSQPVDGERPPSMGNLRLEWVGCDPPYAT